MTRTVGVVACLGVLMLAFVLGVSIYTINETITRGSGYGFTVGDDRTSVLVGIRENHDRYEAIMYTDGKAAYIPVPIGDAPQEELMQSESWYLLIGESNSLLNNIRLRFENRQLVEIRRSRRLFEAP